MKEGIIYKLSFPNKKEYIGQTVQAFSERFKKHLSAAKTFRKGCAALNSAIRKYGAVSIKVEILLRCNLDHMDDYEQKAIIMYNTLSPNGYNLMSGGNSNKTMSDTTKQKMSQSAKLRDTSAYRKNPESMELPKYLIYFSNDRYIGYKISKHPNCESKYFTSRHNTLEKNKENALNFLKKLDNGKKVQKKVRDLPLGIQRYNGGYRIRYARPGESYYIKNFDQKRFSNEENLERCIEHLENVKKEFAENLDETGKQMKNINEIPIEECIDDLDDY